MNDLMLCLTCRWVGRRSELVPIGSVGRLHCPKCSAENGCRDVGVWPVDSLRGPDLRAVPFLPAPGSIIDRGGAVLFDWLSLPAGSWVEPEYRLFSIPVGPGRWLFDTNLFRPGELPAPYGFIVESIHCFYGLMANEDRAAFRERYALRFFILEKYFYTAPLISIPDLGSFLPDVSIQVPEGSPEQPGTLPAGFARYIPPEASFGIILTGRPFQLASSGPGLRFLPVLKGLLDSPVQ